MFMMYVFFRYNVRLTREWPTIQDSSPEMSIPLSAGLSKKEMHIAVAVAAAAVATLAMRDSEAEQKRLESLLSDYILHRMSALEEKVCSLRTLNS
jgi:hypothetical protein